MFVSDVSDHLPVFVITEILSTINSLNNVCSKRSISDTSIATFYHKLSLVNWPIDDDDPNSSYDRFLSIFLKLYNECFPIIPAKRTNTSNKPWFNKNLKRLSKKKLKLYRNYLKNPSESNREKYKTLRNIFTKEIRKIKKNTMISFSKIPKETH